MNRSFTRVLAFTAFALIIQGCGETAKNSNPSNPTSVGGKQIVSQSLPFTAAGIQNYIEGLYWGVLGRQSDPAGMEFWTNAMINGDTNCEDMTFRFLASDERKEKQKEMITNEDFVAYLYRAIFGRDPDQEGFAFWVGFLNQYTVSYQNAIQRGRVIKKFMDNDEFKNRCVNAGLAEPKNVTTLDPKDGKNLSGDALSRGPASSAPQAPVSARPPVASTPVASPAPVSTPVVASSNGGQTQTSGAKISEPNVKQLSITSTVPATRADKFTVSVSGAGAGKKVRAVFGSQTINGVFFEPSKPTFIEMGTTGSTGKLSFTFAIPNSCAAQSTCSYVWYIKVDGYQGTKKIQWNIPLN